MKLPIGIQTFSQVRSDNYIYIDKTKEAHELIGSYKYIFLSRPRRFGKSLFVDTLKNIFEGNKKYFKDLYIEDRYDFNDIYPVIKIDFAGSLLNEDALLQSLDVMMRSNQKRLGLKCDEKLNAPNCFTTLLEDSYAKYKKPAVILIDEYDKPILDNISNRDLAETATRILKDFYSVIKKNDQYIKFTFITGVSKFSKVSLFSGLNNLEDITLNPEFGNICGYTQNDIETSFKPLLHEVNLHELKEWYNGYSFLKDKVYNPFDILLFIRANYTYENYWFETATPSFLLQLIKKNNYYLPDLENIIVGKELLNSFDMENINLEVLLFQTGYLTIKEVLQNPIGGLLYSLTIPNKEVRLSLNGAILNMFIANPTLKTKEQSKAFYALRDAKLDDFEIALTSLFASLPYQNYTNNNIQIYEGFYASVIYTYLSSLGFPLHVEESTNRGRLDMSLKINNNRYIFEFKTDDESGLKQIKDMKYYEKYLNEGSNIFLVGINFDKSDRNVGEFEWEKIDSLEEL